MHKLRSLLLACFAVGVGLTPCNGIAADINFKNLGLLPLNGSINSGQFTYSNSGNTLGLSKTVHVTGSFAYTLTPNTVISFDLLSLGKPDLLGVALVSDLTDTTIRTRTFILDASAANMTKGIADYANKSAGQLGNRHYEIPVGQFYTGAVAKIVLIREGADRTITNLKNLRITESAAINPTPPTPPPPVPTPQPTAYTDGIKNKIIAGYQGWFSCPGEIRYQDWVHWFKSAVLTATNFRVEQWPDTSAYSASETCTTGLVRNDGTPAPLFSSLKAANRHFAMMKTYGIDVAAIQRYVNEISPNQEVRHEGHDRVLQATRAAAESNQRQFYVMYDITGASGAVVDTMLADYQGLIDTMKVTNSPAYLRYNGKPLVAVWGIGLYDGGHPLDALESIRLIQGLKAKGAAVMGGTPTYWRYNANADWVRMYKLLDIISPWSVNAYGRDPAAGYASVDSFMADRLAPDIKQTQAAGIGYMPVIWPGYSWSNQSKFAGALAPMNEIPRRCGRLYWKQIQNVIKAGGSSIYVGMFDEVDEGTAIMPLETSRTRLPKGFTALTQDIEGCTAPSDWYLQLTAKAKAALQSRTLPAVTFPDGR